MRKLNYNRDFTEDIIPIRDTDVYTVTDSTFLKNLTVSETILHGNKYTSGHSHDGLDEVYIFTSGTGRIQIDEEIFTIKEGDIFHVNGGEFHKVYNDNETDLKFIAIFQKYER